MGTGIFEIQRFSEITNRTSDTVITGTDSADRLITWAQIKLWSTQAAEMIP